MNFAYIVFVLTWRCVLGVIYHINESEYESMPALYELDDYDKCMLKSDAIFCLVDADLYTTVPSELMDLIQNYSAYTLKHFNHTQIHRGVCVTETCRDYIKNKSRYTIEDQAGNLEACLNASIWDRYRLKIKISNVLYCKTRNESIVIDNADIFVAVIYVILITLNIVGSFYEVCNRDNKGNNRFLLSFALRRNWARLIAPGGAGPEPRLERLKLFNGIRTMTMICVFFSHTVLIMAYSYVDNPLYIEKSYDDPLKQILFNGSLVTFTFFTMSSFLLAYNLELYAEKHTISWVQVAKGILLRWLRLTPTYALVIATICTWMRHLGSGPLWRQVVFSESEACRQYWWTHLLYINNYVYDNAFCVPQAWYLAADTQLFCLGLVVCVLARSPYSRKMLVSGMLAVGLLLPAVQTYIQDLDAVVIQSPESYRNLYATNATFRLLYASGHANIAVYALGLAGGFLTHHWQNKGIGLSKYRKYLCLYWSVFPLGVAVILTGGFFYIDGARAHIACRVVYAALYKPIFQLLVIILILGTIFKFESVYRGVMEWRGWAWCGRVSYAAFLLHTLFQRGLVGMQRHTSHMSDYYVLMMLFATVFATFLSAAVFWLLVEAPVGQLVKILTTSSPKTTPQIRKTVTIATIETDDGSLSKL